MASHSFFKPAQKLTKLVFPCRTTLEIFDALRRRGMKAVQISGQPGEWSCLVASPNGRAVMKDEIRVSSYVAPCWVAGGRLAAVSSGSTADDHDAETARRVQPSVPRPLPAPHRLLAMVWRCIVGGPSDNRTGIRRRVAQAMRTFALMGIAGSVASASAATMAVSPIQSNTGGYILDLSFTNNDNGVVYNSASTDIVSSLAQDIYALGNSNESSVNDMVNNEWSVNIRNLGEVYNGWSANSVGLATIDLTNNGLISDLSYDTWQNTASNATQDTMALRITVPNYLLDTDGSPGYNALTDHTIGINPVTQANMFTGSEGGVTYSTSGSEYQLNAPVPEPSSAALLALGGFAFLAHRKRA